MATLADLMIKIGMDDEQVAKGTKKLEGRFNKTWGGIQKGAGLAGVAIGAAVIGGAIQGLESEAVTDKLAASLGAEGTEAEELGQIAGSLYANGFGASMDEVASAVEATVSSFDKLGEGGVEKVSEQTLNLAKAFELDVPRAAQVAGQAVKSGLAKDATEALDLLTYSMQKVPKAVREDILDAVDEYGPFMAGIGIKGEKAFGLLVKASEKGMYGIDKTGDALKEFTIRATDMSAASKVGYDALGMSQEKMSAALLKGGDTGAKAFDQIVAGLVGIKDPVKQSQAALALFGTPLEDLSVQEIPNFLKGLQNTQTGMDDAAGATDRLGETLNDNASTKLEAFKRKAQAALVDQLAKAVPYIEKTFGWLQKNSDWVVPLATGLGILATAIGIIVAVQWAWNAALAVSPVTWIVLGIVALIAVIVYLATKTQFFQTIWGAVWGFMKAVGAWFAGPFAGFFVMIGKKIAAFAVGAWNIIKAYFTFWYALLFTVIAKVKAFVVAVWNLVKMYFGFWQGLFKKVVQWGADAISTIRTKFNSFVTWIGGIPGKISSKLSTMWNGLKSGFKTAVNWVIGKWNSIHFSIPSFSVLGKSFGGGSIGVPKIPFMAKGGVVPARAGGTIVNVGEAGRDEAIVPLNRAGGMLGGGGKESVIRIQGDGSKVAAGLIEVLRTAIKDKGGNVQFVIGQKGAA